MAKSALSSIAGMGLAGVLVLLLALLFALSSMTDTEAGALSGEVHAELARFLDEDADTTRIAVRPDGKGADAPRIYTLTVKPSKAVGANTAAVNRLLSRSAQVLDDRLGHRRYKVVIRCRAELADGSSREVAYDRIVLESGRALERREPAPGPGK